MVRQLAYVHIEICNISGIATNIVKSFGRSTWETPLSSLFSDFSALPPTFHAISTILAPLSPTFPFPLFFFKVLILEISLESYRTYFRYFIRYSVGYLRDISWDICEIFCAFMDGKTDVSSISLIWSLSQVVFSMIPAPDILGI